MKTRKLISLAVLIMVLFTSCASTEQVVKVDGISYVSEITVGYKSATEGSSQRYLAENRFDNTKKDAMKEIKDYNRSSYSEKQSMTTVVYDDINDFMNDLLVEKGFVQASDYNKARFNVEGSVDVEYGRNEYGYTWFYDVFITAWDKENAPLDHQQAGLLKLERSVKPTTRIQTTEQFPEMSWSTHGEIYADSAAEAEKILMERLEKEFRNSFINDFFVF